MRARTGLFGSAAAVVACVSLAACGTSAAPRTAGPVRVTLQTQGGRVDTGTVTVSGTVSNARARVLVGGRQAPVGAGGDFRIAVALTPGPNLIDVIAAAPYAQPAMTAVRVVRYVLIAVPSVTGDTPQQAAAAIRSAGLVTRVQGSSDPFAFLLPLPEQVCAQSPSGGSKVVAGSTVTIQTGKVCL